MRNQEAIWEKYRLKEVKKLEKRIAIFDGDVNPARHALNRDLATIEALKIKLASNSSGFIDTLIRPLRVRKLHALREFIEAGGHQYQIKLADERTENSLRHLRAELARVS